MREHDQFDVCPPFPSLGYDVLMGVAFYNTPWDTSSPL